MVPMESGLERFRCISLFPIVFQGVQVMTWRWWYVWSNM